MIEGVKFHPQRFFTVESFIEFQNFNAYKIIILRTRSIKLWLNANKKVLNSNLTEVEISLWPDFQFS